MRTSKEMAPNAMTTEVKQPSLAMKLLTAGSAACVADLATFPLDTAKVRLQVRSSCWSKRSFLVDVRVVVSICVQVAAKRLRRVVIANCR